MPGLYIHIPFCRRKCHYCDFHFSVSFRLKDAVVEALKKELVLRKNLITPPFDSLYFGGGTPSVLSMDEWSEIMQIIQENYSFVPGAECTVEVNPDDVNTQYIRHLKSLGVNRLSIGVQSFDDDVLRSLNRSHNSRMTIDAVHIAQEQGIGNINLDLIYGIPSTTREQWVKNLEIFHALELPHLSAYALTVEERTALHHMIRHHKYPPVKDTRAEEDYRTLIRYMRLWGYTHYEVSNFARMPLRSRHNSNYWTGGEYLGIGPSARSLIQGVRYYNKPNNTLYIKNINQGQALEVEDDMPENSRYNEYVMLRLRTSDGLDIRDLQHRFGKRYKDYFVEKTGKFLPTGRMINTGGVYSIPEEYWFVSDSIMVDLFV